MSPPRRLIHEIHRRSLWQVLGLYMAAAWVSLEVVATFVEQLFLPSWVFPTALGLVLFGLPIILTTAFVQKGIRSKPETVATAIRIGNPASWQKAVAARDELGGVIDMISDEEILVKVLRR